MFDMDSTNQSNESKQLERRLLTTFHSLPLEVQRRELKLLEIIARAYVGKTQAEIKTYMEEGRLHLAKLMGES